MNNDQYSRHLLAALLAAKRAGEAVLAVYNSDFAVGHKKDESPLTLADQQSHEIIMNNLKKSATGNNSEYIMDNLSLPVLSEEGKDIPFDERKRWEYFWLVDPLDGTKEFIKRNGEFTVNIALIHKDRPVLGCIYIPVRDTFYFASVNLGAYKLVNGKTVTDSLSLKELLDSSQKLPLSINNTKFSSINNQSALRGKTSLTIIGSRSHATRELSEFVEQAKKRYVEVEFVSAGSSLKFCLVAEGGADIYPRFGPTMEWDTAAGQAIVEQAEGSVLDTQTKKPLKYNKNNLVNPFFIVSRKGLPSSLLEY